MSDDITTWGGTATKGGETPLLVVRRPRFPGVVFLVIGGGALAIGIIGVAVRLLTGPVGEVGGYAIAAVAGALVLLFGLALAATRITVYDRHYDVKSGFGKPRRRQVDAIQTLRFASQSNGGAKFISLTAWDGKRKKQFMVFTNFRGFPEFAGWLAEHRPEQWAECEQVGLPR